MDVQMGMDGRQTTETIRQWESERHCTPLPIVALTAHAMANENAPCCKAAWTTT
jgi:two-component system sensor histidine kinase BarA